MAAPDERDESIARLEEERDHARAYARELWATAQRAGEGVWDADEQVHYALRALDDVRDRRFAASVTDPQVLALSALDAARDALVAIRGSLGIAYDALDSWERTDKPPLWVSKMGCPSHLAPRTPVASEHREDPRCEHQCSLMTKNTGVL